MRGGGGVINDPPPTPLLSNGSEPVCCCARLLTKSEKNNCRQGVNEQNLVFDSKPRVENSDIITSTADVLVTSLASSMASHSATCYVFAIQRHYHSLTYMHALSEDCTTCNDVTASIDDVRTGDVINEFLSATTCCVFTRCPNMLHDTYALSLTCH